MRRQRCPQPSILCDHFMVRLHQTTKTKLRRSITRSSTALHCKGNRGLTHNERENPTVEFSGVTGWPCFIFVHGSRRRRASAILLSLFQTIDE